MFNRSTSAQLEHPIIPSTSRLRQPPIVTRITSGSTRVEGRNSAPGL
jgi:hypothetical protein